MSRRPASSAGGVPLAIGIDRITEDRMARDESPTLYEFYDFDRACDRWLRNRTSQERKLAEWKDAWRERRAASLSESAESLS
ncbi:hypothetical protein [Luteolibacter sp. LG18]|uniref:hypothetical protein n=1 Tax=Luteolibacter sp. LG18 TaxID=2819286 RepID=UPI002B2911E4|nr:hypothetical protein llg_07270 [Luteolibacter sp. LG18]BCU79644.1 hypothetical protein llg_43590 [Luteolibacter sp. LG18]